MPLAALFIGGVLPAQLDSLIRKRAGYMKKIQPQVEKFNLELNKKKAASCKLQAPSLTMKQGQYRIIKKEK